MEQNNTNFATEHEQFSKVCAGMLLLFTFDQQKLKLCRNIFLKKE